MSLQRPMLSPYYNQRNAQFRRQIPHPRTLVSRQDRMIRTITTATRQEIDNRDSIYMDLAEDDPIQFNATGYTFLLPVRNEIMRDSINDHGLPRQGQTIHQRTDSNWPLPQRCLQAIRADNACFWVDEYGGVKQAIAHELPQTVIFPHLQAPPSPPATKVGVETASSSNQIKITPAPFTPTSMHSFAPPTSSPNYTTGSSSSSSNTYFPTSYPAYPRLDPNKTRHDSYAARLETKVEPGAIPKPYFDVDKHIDQLKHLLGGDFQLDEPTVQESEERRISQNQRGGSHIPPSVVAIPPSQTPPRITNPQELWFVLNSVLPIGDVSYRHACNMRKQDPRMNLYRCVALLNIPFVQKEAAKEQGAHWHPFLKTWVSIHSIIFHMQHTNSR